MCNSKMVEMEVTKEIRVQRLVNEYGASDPDQFLATIGKVTQKLGGQNYNAAKEKLLQGDMASTIEILLTYYDKAYRASIEKRKERIMNTIGWDGKDEFRFAKELVSSVR
jgi:tRNA 2-selenouridine synthase